MQPWHSVRLVLAAFVIKHFENLEASDVTLLQSLEFHVPTFATGELVASGSMESRPDPGRSRSFTL